MSLEKDQIEEMISKLTKLKDEIRSLSEKGSRVPEDSTPDIGSVIRYFAEERERTNKALLNITGKVAELEKMVSEREEVVPQEYAPAIEIPVSTLDGNILDFIKGKGLACADDVKKFMNYKGRNAACTRLKKLEKDGFLEKFQLSHKVYYRYYAGKTTKTLIISPPQ